MMRRIEVHDDVFEHQMHNALYAYITQLEYRDGWHSNSNIEYTQFHAEIGHGGKGNRDDITAHISSPVVLAAWELVQTKVLREKHKLLRCYANKNVYGTEGYPHRDTDKHNTTDITCVCYFCGPEWKLAWCGETALVLGGEIIKSVLPRENRLFLFPSHMKHIARSVTKLCERPRITLMFKSSP